MQYFGIGKVFIFSVLIVGILCSANDLKRLKARVKLLETRLNFQAAIRYEEFAEITERLDDIDNVLNVTDEKRPPVSSETTSYLDYETVKSLKEDYARIRKALRDEKIETERIRREIPKIEHNLVSVYKNVDNCCINTLNTTEQLLTSFKESTELGKETMTRVTEQLDAVKAETKNIWRDFPMIKNNLRSINENVEKYCKGAFDNTENTPKTDTENRLALQDMAEKVQLLSTKVQLNTETDREMYQQVKNLETIVTNHFVRLENLLLNVSTHSSVNNTPVGKFEPVTDEEGWIVFQRRRNGKVDFYRDWAEYKKGFGDLDGEFWLGNDNLSELTADVNRELKIEMEDFEGNSAYAKYSTFKVYPEEDKYKLEVSGFSGTAGDSLEWHSGMMFSTFDNDNEEDTFLNCAVDRHGAWWYNTCHVSNLNGKYFKHHKKDKTGINWVEFNHYFSLKKVEMKLR